MRKEHFGLLFYTMTGPRLYFLSCGGLLDRDFFTGDLTLETWINKNTNRKAISKTVIKSLKNSLNQLHEKGVIIEC